MNERCLLVSARPAEDVALYASAYGISVDEAIESNNLIILEYSEYVPGRDREDQLKLPPDSFIQLKQIIEEQAVHRVILDTVLPWVAIRDQDSLAEHIFSFVRVFHRLGTTSLFTLPKPVSTGAFKLRKLLEDVVPVSVTLAQDEKTDLLTWHVNKYLGSTPLAEGIPYEVKPKQGLVRRSSSSRADAASTPHKRGLFSPSSQEEARVPPRVVPPRQDKKPSFSDLIQLSPGGVPPRAAARHASGPVSGWGSITEKIS